MGSIDAGVPATLKIKSASWRGRPVAHLVRLNLTPDVSISFRGVHVRHCGQRWSRDMYVSSKASSAPSADILGRWFILPIATARRTVPSFESEIVTPCCRHWRAAPARISVCCAHWRKSNSIMDTLCLPSHYRCDCCFVGRSPPLQAPRRAKDEADGSSIRS